LKRTIISKDAKLPNFVFTNHFLEKACVLKKTVLT